MHMNDINDDNSVRMRMLFLSKSISEICDIVKTRFKKLNPADIPVILLKKMIDSDNVNDFIKIYELIDNKIDFARLIINGQQLLIYVLSRYAFKIFNSMGQVMIDHRIYDVAFPPSTNILHLAFQYKQYDMAEKIYKIKPELIFEVNIYGTPFHYFLEYLFTTCYSVLVNDAHMNIITMIDKDTYKKLLNYKSSSQLTIYLSTSSFIIPIRSTFVDILEIIISNDIIANDIVASHHMKKINDEIYKIMFGNNECIV